MNRRLLPHKLTHRQRHSRSGAASLRRYRLASRSVTAQASGAHASGAHASSSSANALHFSSRGLDMCLLAVCSCALSLMCHQTGSLLNLPSVSSASMSPASGNAARVDFVVKAGLVTTRQESERHKQQPDA